MLTPYAETQVADIIRDHTTRKTPLKIIGGNTRSGFGNAVEADETLSSRAMAGIIAYNPAEMVMTVKAGTPLATVEAALAENRQMMAFEPMDHRPIMGTTGEPTIGGVFAANVSDHAVMWLVRRVTACSASVSSMERRKSSRPVAG